MTFDLETVAAVHTVLSFIALLAVVVAVAGLLGARVPSGSTTLFLVAALATSATGFLFPFFVVLPSHVVGVIALVVPAVVMAARYRYHLAGAWRWIYAAGMVTSLYLLAFVVVAQAFKRIPALQSLAPTQTELPFVLAQLATLVLFVLLGVAAARSFRPLALAPA